MCRGLRSLLRCRVWWCGRREEIRDHPFWGRDGALESVLLPRHAAFDRFLDSRSPGRTAQTAKGQTHVPPGANGPDSPHNHADVTLGSVEDDDDDVLDRTVPGSAVGLSAVEEVRMSVEGGGGGGSAGVGGEPNDDDDDVDDVDGDATGMPSTGKLAVDLVEQRLRLLDVILAQVGGGWDAVVDRQTDREADESV